MTEHALKAVYRGLRNRLVGDGNYAYNQNVRASLVKASTPYPYVVYFWSGGGALNETTTKDAMYRIGVKAVSEKLAEAMNAAAQISDLLDDKGEAESPSDYVNGGDDWKILTVTEEDSIYLVEQPPDTITVYHVGAFYRFHLDAR